MTDFTTIIKGKILDMRIGHCIIRDMAFLTGVLVGTKGQIRSAAILVNPIVWMIEDAGMNVRIIIIAVIDKTGAGTITIITVPIEVGKRNPIPSIWLLQSLSMPSQISGAPG